MGKIRIGIVGLGRFAEFHAACLKQIPAVEIAAVCDTAPGRAEAWAQSLSCRAYADTAAMLRSETLDALDVLTPETLHYDAVMAGLEAGCHIFVEKPLDVDPQRAEYMAAYAAERRKLLMVGHVARFDPRFIKAKQSIAAGKLGRIRSIHAKRSDRREVFGLYKRTPIPFILSIHDIDLILWYTGSFPVEVYAVSSSSSAGEDMVSAMLTLADGTVAVLESNWLVPGKWPAIQDQFMQVTGDAGLLRVQNPDSSFLLSTEETNESPYWFTTHDVHGTTSGPLLDELRHFAACAEASRASDVLRTSDALNAVRVADAIVRSCALRQPVRLNPEAGR